MDGWLETVKVELDKIEAIKTLCDSEANRETKMMFARKNLAKDILKILDVEE